MSSSLNRMQMDDFCAWNGTEHTGMEGENWQPPNTALQVMLQVMLNSKSVSPTGRSAVTTAPVATDTQ